MARFSIYRSYQWIDKDPIIDAVRTVVQSEKLSYQQIHELSGVSVTTLLNWFDGDTRRPSNTTVSAVTAALGYVRRDEMDGDGKITVGYRQARKIDLDEELALAEAWLRKNMPKRKAKRRRKA